MLRWTLGVTRIMASFHPRNALKAVFAAKSETISTRFLKAVTKYRYIKYLLGICNHRNVSEKAFFSPRPLALDAGCGIFLSFSVCFWFLLPINGPHPHTQRVRFARSYFPAAFLWNVPYPSKHSAWRKEKRKKTSIALPNAPET